MSIPKSAEGYSKLMKKLQVWFLFLGTLLLMILLFVKSGYFKKLIGFKEVDIPPPICKVEVQEKGHVDLIELPNVIEIMEAMERECPGSTSLDHDRDRDSRTGDDRAPDLDRMV